MERQPTRLYGHSIADVVALSDIAGLISFDGLTKFEATLKLLASNPVLCDFGVESDPKSVRYGMLSVLQPQLVCTITKQSDVGD